MVAKRGNTVGSRWKINKECFWAYVAGFLDGDGCIAIRIEKRDSYRLGYKIRVRISFTQHRQRRQVLDYLREKIGSGVVAQYEHNNMAEYVIRDQKVVEELLRNIEPFVVVKHKHLKISQKLLEVKKKGYNSDTLEEMFKLSLELGKLNNYPKRIFRLTP